MTPAARPAPYHRFVALGDSFTEGVGDPDPDRPNGVRGWADLVAEVLAGQTDDFGYANLAIRGRKLGAVLEEQLRPAIAMRPDLVTLYAGANDIMRPTVDLDALMERYDAAVGELSATGARVVLFTAFDPGGSTIYRALRGRFAVYSELVRWIAERHHATLVDYWRLREYRDWGLWDADRMHMNAVGHHRMAIAVLDTLGVSHRLEPVTLDEGRALTRRQQRREDFAWVRGFLVPWVHRRVTGRSSGDGLTPRRPRLAPVAR